MSTEATHITGPGDTRFGILRHNIVLQLLLYYVTIFLVGWAVWHYLPPWLKETVSSATQPLVGTSGMEGTFTTPDPGRYAQTPLAVAIMGFIAATSALVFCLPVSWVYMYTRRKKGFQQSVVHTLLLLPLVIAVLTTLVRSNIALAFGLAGMVAAVRFRVALDDSKDAVYVFAVMALGLASGVQLEAASVLSVMFVGLSLVLWQANYARTPPALEGERAQKHMERALAIANRTSQFVARMDREILEGLAPAQLEALQSRIDRRREKLGVPSEQKEDDSPRFDGRLTITVTDPDQAQPTIESSLEARARRWKVVRVERNDGEARLVYSVKARKGSTIDEVAAGLSEDGSPFVANVETERWA